MSGMDVHMDDASQRSQSRRSSASQQGMANAPRAVASGSGSGEAPASSASGAAPSANDIAERLTMERLSMLDK